MKSSHQELLVVSLISLSLNATAAIYKEAGGIVVVEAEHFDTRTSNESDLHHWAIMPDENGDPDFAADSGLTNARGDKYMQSLPDSAGGGSSHSGSLDQVGIDPYLDYKVQISTPGLYRLWLRWAGYDGSSDSMYGQIRELMAPAGPGPDFYKYVAALSDGAPFGVWTGIGAPSTDTANAFAASGGEVPAVWPLEAGTYTIRLSMREDGCAVDALILQLASLPAPTDPGPPESGTATAFITVTQQPADAGLALGQTATLTVSATGSATPTYQWQKAAPGSTEFVDIAGATGTSITTAAATLADNGTRYRVVLSAPDITIHSREALVTVDVVAPIAYRAVGGPTFDKVTVVFSEAISAASGTNSANFSIAGLTISDATLAADGTNVILSTSTQTTGTVYTVTVKDIQDLVTPANVLAPNPTTVSFTSWVLGKGGALQSFWENITPNNIDALRNDPRFPDNPTFTTTEPVFEYPANGANEAGSNYGNRLTALVSAPVTGDYVFYVCSDDPSELYLSTDDDPVNKKLIAQETAWSNAREWVISGGSSDLTSKRSDQFVSSEWPTPNVISLTAGRLYYMEVLHTEGGGGDNVGVTWQLPGADEPANGAPPIPGDNLYTYMNPDVATATVTLTAPSDGATFADGANITLTANAVDNNGPIRTVEFFAGNNKLGESATAPFTFTWNSVPSGRYTLAAQALDRQGYVITSSPIRILVGTPRPFIYFVTADPGPLTFAGDIAVHQRLLNRGFDVELARGSDVPADGSTALGKNLIIQSSSLGSGTVEDANAVGKFRNVAIPAMEWEASSQDAFGFQAANGTTTADQTQINIVDAASPLAAGLPSGLLTVSTPEPYSQGTPDGAHIVATLADDSTQAVIYYYDKGDTGFDGLVMPERRVFFFFGDNTAAVATTDGLKLFDAAVDWLLAGQVTPPPPPPPGAQFTKFAKNNDGTITVEWTGGGTLQTAPAVTGPWQDVAGAISPYTFTPTATALFGRIRT